MSPHVLPLTALRVDPPCGTELVSLTRLRCRTTALLTPDGMQHLLFQENGHSLQLAVSGAPIFDPARLLTDAAPHLHQLAARLSALACLNHILASGRLAARYFPREPRGPRLRIILRALDGWRAGAPYREIATALFGRARVDADWTDPGDHLRDRVRRAVRRGRALMDGGYVQLLRCVVLLLLLPGLCRPGC